MASTRNINTAGNYALEQKTYALAERYELYENSQHGRAYNDAQPSVGITASHMPRDALSHNPIEIESMLFGINSTNLVNPRPEPRIKAKTLPEKKFFERIPIIMPAPLVVENKQRPLPMA